MTVVPVIAAVTAAVWTFAPPEPFGTRRRIAPLPKSTVREPWLKLKIVLAPNRAMVRSPKVNSARDSGPVRTAVSPRTVSVSVAGRGSVWPETNFTSLTTWVTRASLITLPVPPCPLAETTPSARTPSAPLANNKSFFMSG